MYQSCPIRRSLRCVTAMPTGRLTRVTIPLWLQSLKVFGNSVVQPCIEIGMNEEKYARMCIRVRMGGPNCMPCHQRAYRYTHSGHLNLPIPRALLAQTQNSTHPNHTNLAQSPQIASRARRTSGEGETIVTGRQTSHKERQRIVLISFDNLYKGCREKSIIVT